jgi:Tol biopolymer transport system component
MRRFTQEAKSAAALHHPNIAQIFEIGDSEDAHYIAMEFVEGETLRELISRRKLEIKKAVELAAQVASGLATAHKAGVIHRDIKPDNLIVTAGGQIKILDFGLAKLVDKERGAAGISELTTAYMHSGDATTPGAILGTVSYMSPEQARAEKLDQRTDIFSLGVVLFEMVTGERPFKGKSAIDTLHAIINQDPPPLTELNSQLPPELADILSKALAKEVSERYQHAGDFELDLRRFKRALESNSLISAQVRMPASTQLAPKSRSRFPILVAGALIVVGVAAAAYLLGHSTVTTRQSTPALENVTLMPLTTDPGYEGEPTFSPDSETIAYVSDRTGNFDIFIKQISGGPDIQLTSSPADDVQPAFSPDGKQIAFVSTRSSQTGLLYPVADSPMIGGDIWIMSALGDKGGNARRIIEGGNFPSWSPDGKFILYVSGAWRSPRIFTAPSTGGEAREIPLKFADSENPGGLGFYPRYSSDGRWILFQSNNAGVYVVKSDGGEALRIAQGKAPVWNADSTAIIYSNKEPGKNQSLWEIPFSLGEGKTTGPAQPLTVGRGWDLHAALSRDGKLIAFTAEDDSFNIERVAFDAETGRVTGQPETLTTGQNINFFMNFSPDAHSVVFGSARGSSSHIWRVDADAPPVQLTSDPNFNDSYPRWSPGGRSIAFLRSSVDGPQTRQSLWLMSEDGANPQKLADGVGWYTWMPDGRAIVGLLLRERQHMLLDVSTGEKRPLTNEQGVMPVVSISSDGRWAAYQSSMSANVDIRAVPVGGGESRAVVTTPRYDYHPFFSPSGRWLYFGPDHKNIYRVPGPAQDWRQGEPEKVTNFPESGLFLEDPQFSRDGRWLLYSRGRITGDIWVMNLAK